MVQSKGIRALSQVKFIGEERAQAIIDALGIESIEEVIKAAQSDQLLQVPGIGKATQKRILESALAVDTSSEPSEVKPSPKPSTPSKKKAAPSKKKAAPSKKKATPVASTEVSDTPAASPKVLTPDVQTPETAREFLESVLICPNCGHDGLEARFSSLVCSACRREYSEHQGAVDMAPPYSASHNPTQRVMESQLYAKYYESIMRPRLTAVVSSRGLDHEYELSTRYLELESGSRVLDVACGTGNFSRHFAQHVAAQGLSDVHIVGVDLSVAMLERAHQYIQGEQLTQQIAMMRGDATKLPLQRGSFDRIHCAAALHFMSDPDEALSQFARVLTPDGVCVLTTFIKGRGVFRRLAKSLMQRPTGFGWFSEEDLTRRLNQAGFDVMAQSVDGDAITIKARRI